MKRKMHWTKLGWSQVSSIQISFNIKNHLLMKAPKVFAWSWNMLMEAILRKGSQSILEKARTLRKKNLSTSLPKWSLGSRHSMTPRSVTEISNVPIFSWLAKERPNWATSTFQKCSKEECSTLRQEHHIMQVLKFGRISLMTRKAISGHWDV